ncbi:MAG: hypothetical protein COW30_17060 [Rhodospirillales bacterium CG15_BIG_FIL_POST_REV_8_21_14_020_66_15]|nr:MAG: hypothetical protein COW30_17060 [Rhodospirillales bacterium CG15_BIG_FIL_POST_REV_8_21_14_020_66_15]
MRKTKSLIEQIIKAGRSRGLNAAALATRSGISPSNLSRARGTGRFSADTLERLLAAADVEVTVTAKGESDKDRRALQSVVTKLNAGRKVKTTPEEFKRLLLRFRPSAENGRLFSHLVGLIEEIPVSQVHDLVLEGSASLPALARIAAHVEGRGPTVEWINERTGKKNRVA